MNGAVSKVNKKFISRLTRAQRTPSAAATAQVSNALITILQFPACSNHWLAGTLLKRLTHVIRHTRSTRTLAFTQASTFHKLSVPPSYVIPVWCVFSKPCTKLTLHCNHRSGHLKTEHKESLSLLLLRRHLGNWPPSKHEKRTAGSACETWTAAAADGVRCARVRREINFLLTFETAPFFCVYPIYTGWFRRKGEYFGRGEYHSL